MTAQPSGRPSTGSALKALGHLVRFRIEGLFGQRTFEFDLTAEEPTILTGSNGSGKSTILRTIDAIATANLRRLATLPFTKAVLCFDQSADLVVTRQEGTLTIAMDEMRASFRPEDLPEIDVEDLSARATRLGARLYDYRGQRVTQRELRQLIAREQLESLPGAEWVAELPRRLPILFITDQRLIVDMTSSVDELIHFGRATTISTRHAVQEAARHVARLISVSLSQYATQSQRLDRDFPRRVVQAMASDKEVPLAELVELMARVAEERKALQNTGLLPTDVVGGYLEELPLNDPRVRPVIKTFAEDTQQKFAVLRDFRARLTLFVEFLGQHYESKRVEIDREAGFLVTMPNGTSLNPVDLSSGEQQILVLAYEILFRAERGTLVMIDEPELSLHVLWQDTFIDDLTRMGRAQNLAFLLATHSPALIGGRDDLRRSLDVASN